MLPDSVPLIALPNLVEAGVGLVSIALAGVVLVLGLRRRESGYDLMLIISALVVMLLAVGILAVG